MSNFEETLILAEESRLKMLEKQTVVNTKPIDFSKLNKLYEYFVPQTQLSSEELFWSSTPSPPFDECIKRRTTLSPHDIGSWEQSDIKVKEREHIKLEYKKLYDLIKKTRAKTKLQIDSLQQKLNDQISENNKLRAQLKGKFSESQMNHNGTSVNTKLSRPPTLGNKLYSVTPLSKSKVIPKVVEKKDLSKAVPSHLNPKKIIEKCTKFLAPCLLMIESEPINAYFKNDRVVHRDYLKVTKEHVATLQELLEEARALKPLDEHIGHASKFTKRIQELLVYVSAPCPFTQSGNEKWAPATSHRKNNKPYVDASRTKQTIETIIKERAMNNTKNDRISQPSSRSMKNKVEAHHRKFKSSANKNNHVLDCNVNVKNVALSKNSDTICLSCNECLFSVNHDACGCSIS
ncbi:hypothetical protein Tco_1194206 [Tanacetum coccineum]